LDLVAGLKQPTTGRCRVDGRLVEKPGKDRGMVPQSYTLFPWLTVQKNVEFGLSLQSVGAKEKVEIARHYVNAVGLTAFAEAYPRKWLLYDTKIKDFTFKFYIDNKKAQVLLDIEPKDEEKRKIYYEKIESLKTILHEEYLPEAILERNFYLDNGKVISRIWIEKLNVSLNNRNYWPEIFEFFSETMTKFELFFFEFEEYIKDLEMNT
jgi:hypothetical protein